MRKLKLNTIFMILLFCCISITAILSVNSINRRFELMYLTRGYKSDNAITFVPSGSNNLDLALLYNALSQSKIENICLKKVSNKDQIVQYIFFTYEPDLKPNSGRNFSLDDNLQNKNVAIVGENIKYMSQLGSSIASENGQYFKYDSLYIEKDSQYYEVVGIMSESAQESIINSMTIINSLDDNMIDMNGYYIIDSDNDNINCINAAYELLSSVCGIRKVDKEQTVTERMMSGIISQTLIVLLIMGLLSLCSITISYGWMQKQKKEIAVKKLLGWKDSRLRLEIVLKYIIFSFAGIILSWVFCSLLFSLDISLTFIIKYFMLFVASGMIILIYPLITISKVSVAQSLK